MAECLGRNLQRMVEQGSIMGLKPSSSNMVYTHQQFMDDTILMGRSTMVEARNMRKALDDYELASGQMVNRQKSSIFFFNTLKPRQKKMAKILKWRIESLPSIYMGFHLGLKPPDSFWNVLIDRFSEQLAGWKGALLSQACKIQLLKATL
ncbi:uncharacterized protein LOC131051207 [Cryptomeria japonica]|uniref:uncharacterized protein LOC131051207 n=1 Tax=Cryptomeria japonica TaxID=3369 RepID=UPI0027DA6BC9|nr:uncharacterized protein LOC131051207 [Cryptomeria japonica]